MAGPVRVPVPARNGQGTRFEANPRDKSGGFQEVELTLAHHRVVRSPEPSSCGVWGLATNVGSSTGDPLRARHLGMGEPTSLALVLLARCRPSQE